MASYPRIELFRGADGKFYFHKRSRNGRITEASQGYKHKHSAKKAAKRDIPDLPIISLTPIPKPYGRA